MQQKTTITAAFLGLAAIILGAFGAHLLKNVLTIAQLTSFEIGVKYQMYHALFLLFVSLSSLSEKSMKTILFLTFFGVTLFSGSIYLLTTKSISGIDFRPIGFLTPIGGLFLISGWAVLLFEITRKKH